MGIGAQVIMMESAEFQRAEFQRITQRIPENDQPMEILWNSLKIILRHSPMKFRQPINEPIPTVSPPKSL
jgi:hypothetical protein